MANNDDDGTGSWDEPGPNEPAELVRPGPALLANDPWDFLPDEDVANEAYHGRRRASGKGPRVWLVLAPVVSLAVVVAGFSYALLGHPAHHPPALALGSDDPAGVDPSTTRGRSSPSRGTTGGRTSPAPSGSATPGLSPTPPGGSGSASPSSTPSLGVVPLMTLEAEAAGNTLSGSAVTASLSGASGGSIVDGLGKTESTPGAVQFNAVTVATAGVYVVTIWYVTTNDYTADIWVNGGAANPVFAPAQSTCCATAQVSVTLQAGPNTIRIGNLIAPSPAIDKIVIS